MGEAPGGERILEVRFPITGEELPVDHGWWMFAAVSAVAEVVHERTDVVVGPVAGASLSEEGRLRLVGGREGSYLPLRAPASVVPELFMLAGRQLRVGEAHVKLGVPMTHRIRPAAALNARLVVLTNREAWPEFDQELRRQLDVLEVEADVLPGRRRVLTVKGARNVGYAIGLSGLSAEGSVRVLEHGLGGRRSMGAGFFVPGWLPEGAMATVRDLNLDREG